MIAGRSPAKIVLILAPTAITLRAWNVRRFSVVKDAASKPVKNAGVARSLELTGVRTDITASASSAEWICAWKVLTAGHAWHSSEEMLLTQS